MKKFKLLMVLAVIFSMAISPSCGDDSKSCDETTCLNGGVCDTGTCICEAGYEGTLCETLSRAKLFGNYALAVSCEDGTNYTGTASVVADASDDLSAIISTSTESYKITMTGVSSFGLPEQTACPNCDLVEGGSGAVDGEEIIEFEAVFIDGSTCTYTLTPQ